MAKIRDNCKKCGKLKDIHTVDGWCNWCYRKYRWNPDPITCPRCWRILPHHAQGLCTGCYNSVYNLENVKKANYRKWHNIDLETYRELTKQCVICGFDKVVELHHLDHNKQNTSHNNLAGLCPNHHKMLHTKRYQKEVFDILREKGFKVPESSYSTEEFTTTLKEF